jgi:hypothetical protein
MPVRIVRDNAEEESISENFNFDNPNDNSQQNNYNDNSYQDNSNNGGSSGGFDLGGIANMLFGGGGSSHSTSNSLVSNLASMAIGACVSYAISSFKNTQRTSSSSYQSAASPQHTRQDLENLYQARMQAAQTCVSLWAYAVGADRSFADEERQTIENLLDSTVQQLFPSSVANQEDVRAELQETFNRPLPYEKVISQAQNNKQFALQLYQQAALIIAADGNYAGREQNFLSTLLRDLNLSSSEVSAIHQQFGF